MSGIRHGWTHVRLRERTKELAAQEAAWRQEAYELSRSPRPISGERVTIDEIIYEALAYVRSERRRKNLPKRLRKRRTR